MSRNALTLSLAMVVLVLSACMPIQDPSAVQTEAASQPPPMAIASSSDVPRITLEEAKAHFDNGTAVFMDARSQLAYDQAHIAGAILRPLSIAAPGDDDDFGIPKDQLIITYCT